ncbi:MAG: hypothetical protein AVDCRST_MAG21-1136 [uncultured Nocardioidaceae bacterium]|uniref:Uncharacterized protein n=1 Tax=uncultured Nocardioidaceae bacterium TaxID=253824 RepID=A0A6J4MYK2_9ACTN|nr:MAG: hypothetical protein AVDCRST_MAG21-1136 [uncultured Nocardioidaceae bacterium]
MTFPYRRTPRRQQSVRSKNRTALATPDAVLQHHHFATTTGQPVPMRVAGAATVHGAVR